MKRYLFCMTTVSCFILAGNAEELPPSDVRSEWYCAYPYTESNCQTVLFAWSKDQEIPWESVFTGSECSGCDPEYYEDQNGYRHLLYARCMNKFGAKFTSKDFIAPIKRYKESKGDSTGWNILDWRFAKCFETWECGEHCSLNTHPPSCLRYQSTNWGLYEPVVKDVCSYGESQSDTPPSYQYGQSPSTEQSDTDRDTTWTPTY